MLSSDWRYKTIKINKKPELIISVNQKIVKNALCFEFILLLPAGRRFDHLMAVDKFACSPRLIDKIGNRLVYKICKNC